MPLTSPGGAAARWRLPPARELQWRRLDGDVVVRSSQDAGTHLLSDAAATVVQVLAERGPLDVAALAALVLPTAAVGPDDERALESLLDQLRTLGIVEAVDA